MDYTQLFAQGGISLLVVVVSLKAISKLYDDMREDSKSREETLKSEFSDRIKESKEREEKLMHHQDKVAETLENIHTRLCALESKKEGENK